MTLPKNIVMIHFDDGYKSVAEYGYSILSIQNMKGTAFPICKWTGIGEHMTMHDLQFLQNHGWSICNHTFSHESMTKISFGRIRNEIAFVLTLFQSYGLTGGMFLAYPRGLYNDKVINIVSKSCLLARTTRGSMVGKDIGRYNVPSVGISSYNQYCEYIEKLEGSNIIILLFHSVGASSKRATNISISDLMKICRDLNKRRKSNQLEVLTMEEYYEQIMKENCDSEYTYIW